MMTEPSDDRALEAALRALETPTLPAADRAAIRAAIRAAGPAVAGPAVGDEPLPSAPAGRLPHGWPLALAAAALALGAAAWQLGRGPRAMEPAPPPAVAATPVHRTTAVAHVVARDAQPSAAPSLPAPDTAPPRAPDGAPDVVRLAAVARRVDSAPRPTDVPPPDDLPAPPAAPPPADPPHRPDRDGPSQPTATPGPVLPPPPSGEAPTPTVDAGAASSPTASPLPITGIAGVVRLDGAPFAYAAVRAVPADGGDGAFVVGSSDGDGAYVLRLPPGAWHVAAEGEGWPSRWWPGATTAEDAAVVVVVAGAVTGGIDFELR